MNGVLIFNLHRLPNFCNAFNANKLQLRQAAVDLRVESATIDCVVSQVLPFFRTFPTPTRAPQDPPRLNAPAPVEATLRTLDLQWQHLGMRKRRQVHQNTKFSAALSLKYASGQLQFQIVGSKFAVPFSCLTFEIAASTQPHP